MASTLARRDVVIPNVQGLHARPIAQLVAAATKYQATLRVRHESAEADGKSVLQMMTLCAGKGAVLQLCAEGKDAEALIAAVAAVVEAGFGEP